MLRRYKLLVGLGLIVLVGVLGIGIALAADPPQSSARMDHKTFVTKLAERLGVSEAKLTEAIGAAHGDMLDEAVKAGQLTQEQADQMKRHMEQMGSGAGLMGQGIMDQGAMGSMMRSMMGSMGSMGSMMGSGGAHCTGATGSTQ